MCGVFGIQGHPEAANLAYLGLHYTTAINGAILNSCIPVMIVALSWVLLHERLAPLQALGIFTSLAGVLTILAAGSLATLLAFRLNVGDVLYLASMAMWSIYTIALRGNDSSTRHVAIDLDDAQMHLRAKRIAQSHQGALIEVVKALRPDTTHGLFVNLHERGKSVPRLVDEAPVVAAIRSIDVPPMRTPELPPKLGLRE